VSRAFVIAARAFVLAAAALAAGCTTPRTEVVLVVTTDGVRIPDDVDAIRLQVFDANAGSEELFDMTFHICTGGLTTGCVPVPLNFTLVPGQRAPSDSVRVQLTAMRDATPVIDDAALFTFTPQQSLQLDFVLYADCIGNVTCAERDKACGPDNSCITVSPTPLKGNPDLGVLHDDMHRPRDLAGAGGEDMTSTPDLGCVADCTGIQCGAAPNCPGVMCGGCDSASLCDDVSHSCVPAIPCGQNDGVCCLGGTQCQSSGYHCIGGTPPICRHCGDPGEACCPSSSCFGSAVCNGGTCTMPCGSEGEMCCAGNSCPGSGSCNLVDGLCELAGADTVFGNWDAQSYSTAPAASSSFRGVWGTNTPSQLVVAVGTNGQIYRHASGSAADTFDQDRSGGVPILRVQGSTMSSALYAVGASNTVLGSTFASAAWSNLATGTSDTVNRTTLWVNPVTSNDVWLSGDRAPTLTTTGPVLDHLSSAAWSEPWAPTGGTAIGGIWGDGSGFFLLAGTDTASFVFVNAAPGNGEGSATPVDSPSPTGEQLFDVWGSSSADVFVVGTHETILHYSEMGTSMRANPRGTMPSPSGSFDAPQRYNASGGALYGVSGTGFNDIWAVGDGGLVLHSDGIVWTAQSNTMIPSTVTLFDVIALSATEIYVVGGDSSTGLPVIYHAH
jgi:hypothetical protein